MKLALWTFFGVLVVALFGCGGGGKDGGFKPRQDSFSVGANQTADKTFGEIGVKVNSIGTFPTGSTVTLTQSPVATQMPPTTNFVLAKPALKLESSEVAKRDLIVTIPDDGQDYIAAIATDSEWLPLRFTKANGKINFTLPASLGRSTNRGGGKVWDWVVGKVKDNLSDPDYAIKHLEGNAEFASPGTILCLHGILDNAESMRTLGARAKVKFGGSNVRSFAYPWRDGAKAAGIELADQLKPYKNKLKNVTIVAYSQGVLVARYALERLGATASVKTAILIAGPNLGGRFGLANASDLLYETSKDWLNATSAGSPFDADVNDPAIKEFKSNGPFLTDLNTYRNGQRGDVDYYLFAGSRDLVVDRNSALADGVVLEELTGGSVWRHVIGGAGHLNIKSNVTLIDRMFDSIVPSGLVFGDELTIVLDPTDEVNAQTDGWIVYFSIKNNTNSPISLGEMTIESYTRDGQVFTTRWYDPTTPGGQFFPLNYATWGRTLGADQATEVLGFRVVPDLDGHNIDEVPVNLQARTLILILTGTLNGQPVKAKAKLICRYGDIRPSPANTRSAAKKENGGGAVSPIK